jgi:hypothetical protein
MLFLRYFFCKDLMNSSKSRSKPMTLTPWNQDRILLLTHREQGLVNRHVSQICKALSYRMQFQQKSDM